MTFAVGVKLLARVTARNHSASENSSNKSALAPNVELYDREEQPNTDWTVYGNPHHASINLLLETLSVLGYDVSSDLPGQQLAYSEQEAAKLLSISPRTLFTLRKEGKVRAVKVGNRVIYSREELKRFLAAGCDE